MLVSNPGTILLNKVTEGTWEESTKYEVRGMKQEGPVEDHRMPHFPNGMTQWKPSFEMKGKLGKAQDGFWSVTTCELSEAIWRILQRMF